MKILPRYLVSLKERTGKYIEDSEEIRGCFLKVMGEFFAECKNDSQEKDVASINESDLIELATSKAIGASQLLFEAMIVCTVLAVGRKEAVEVSKEGDA